MGIHEQRTKYSTSRNGELLETARRTSARLESPSLVHGEDSLNRIMV